MKNNFVIKSILVVAPLVMLTACQTTGSTSGALQAYQPNLEPLSQDTSILPVGTTADFYEGFDDDGADLTSDLEVEFDDGKKMTLLLNGFCTKTYDMSIDPYSEMSWDCGENKGSRTISNIQGKLWPLTVGNTMSFTEHGKIGSRTWTSPINCNVEGTERIVTIVGEFDTYRVICKNRFFKHTYWYTQGYKFPVKYERWNYGSRNIEAYSELMQIKPPS